MRSLYLPSEKAVAALFLALVATLFAAVLGPAELAPASAMLAVGLSWASLVDLDRFILPDIVTLSLLVAGLALASWNGLAAALPFVIGAAAGYVSLAGIAWFYRKIKGRSGLGLGDAKLLAVSGAWLGWTALPMVVLLASAACIAFVTATAMIHRRAVASGPIPFGPYLAAATWLLWLTELGGRP